MKRKITLFLFLIAIFLQLRAQDYFADLTSGTTPVLFNGISKALFSATINAGDNSVKSNFFRQYWINSEDYKPLNVPRDKKFWGWGLNTKVKTEDGLGALFKSGQFTPGFTAGSYFSFSRMYWKDSNDQVFGHWVIILSGTLSTSKFQLYHPATSFDTQLSDTNFNGRSLSLSFVNGLFKGRDNMFIGISITGSRMNNYSDLDKVEIKNDSVFTNGSGSTRIAEKINDDGNIYGLGIYKQYNNLNIRANLSYIPSAFSYFIAFIIYPSVDISSAFKPKYNVGVSFAHLKQGSPSTADASLFLELNDITNVTDKKDSFFKRAFKFGVSTTLNVFSSTK